MYNIQCYGVYNTSNVKIYNILSAYGIMKIHSIHYLVYTVQCTVYSVQSTVFIYTIYIYCSFTLNTNSTHEMGFHFYVIVR